MNDCQLGAWGEHLVVAELLQRSFYVATPIVDIDGYDILAGNTPNLYHRVQVKSSRQPTKCNKSARLAYRFFGTRHESDFHILCCLMHKSFYVVPTLDMPPVSTARNWVSCPAKSPLPPISGWPITGMFAR